MGKQTHGGKGPLPRPYSIPLDKFGDNYEATFGKKELPAAEEPVMDPLYLSAANLLTLLGKYIDHVGNCEGVTFLSDHDRYPNQFTDEEWALLQLIDRQGAEA